MENIKRIKTVDELIGSLDKISQFLELQQLDELKNDLGDVLFMLQPFSKHLGDKVFVCFTKSEYEFVRESIIAVKNSKQSEI